MISTRTIMALAGLGMTMGKFDCSQTQDKYQVGWTPATTTYTVYKNGVAVISRVDATITSIDACDLSPKDDNMYCVVQRNAQNAGNFDYDLVRVDSAAGTLTYIAAVVRNCDNAGDCGIHGGAFTPEGHMIVSKKAGLLSMIRPDLQIGSAAPTDSHSMTATTGAVHGRDLTVEGNYIYSIVDNNGVPTLVRSTVADALNSLTTMNPLLLTPTAASVALPGSASNFQNMWIVGDSLYVQHDTLGVYKIVPNTDGATYTVTEESDALPPTGAVDAGSCKYVQCTCLQNGISTANSWCPATAPNVCHECDDGHYLSNGVCKPNMCSCPNGKADTSCSTHEAIQCLSCNVGYYGPKCIANQCTCANGVGKQGTDCSSHGSEECASCNPGYRKVGDICVKKHKPTQPPATCKCTGGWASHVCADTTQESCIKCYPGFVLSANTCMVVGDTGSMPGNVAAAPSPAYSKALMGLSDAATTTGHGGPSTALAETGPGIKFGVLASMGVLAGIAATAVLQRLGTHRMQDEGLEFVAEHGQVE